MDKKVLEEKETKFNSLLAKPPYPVEEMLKIIGEVPPGKADEMTANLLQALTEAGDFPHAYQVVKARAEPLAARLQPAGIRDVLKKTTKDRLVAAFIDSVDFGVRPLAESLARLDRLLAFQPGLLVLNPTWGLGEIKRLDYFYRRITIDFRGRKGHQMTFPAACETLTLAPEDHVLVIAHADPARIAAMIKDHPGEFVKAILKSYGDLPVTRVEEICEQNGFVKSANWKPFWESARHELHKDPLVFIPARRADPIHLKAVAESYGDAWFAAFASMTDPKEILSAVRDLEAAGKVAGLDDAAKAKLEDRLAFALKGVRGVDDALYSSLACAVSRLGFINPPADQMRSYLWEHDRYLDAARELPAREVGALLTFLLADDNGNAKKTILDALPRMCFQLLSEVLEHFAADEACEAAVAKLLREPKAPATLVTYVLGRRAQFQGWKKLPPLVVVLNHAIALGEGRQNGETLRMQNMIRRLFADSKWLTGVFGELAATDRELFFERFQASIAWDPSTHHTITVRMTHICPELASRIAATPAAAAALARITSFRSYAERKAAFLKLINEEIPANVRDIQEAKEKGDLSENAEYQYAKDKEKQLLQKQTVMQEELNSVKPNDFADIAADEVRPGTTVELRLADGATKTYTVLGEWDHDEKLGVIADKTRLAQNMLGKKTGDSVEVPDAEGHVSVATIAAVKPLSAELREWIQLPQGMSI